MVFDVTSTLGNIGMFTSLMLSFLKGFTLHERSSLQSTLQSHRSRCHSSLCPLGPIRRIRCNTCPITHLFSDVNRRTNGGLEHLSGTRSGNTRGHTYTRLIRQHPVHRG